MTLSWSVNLQCIYKVLHAVKHLVDALIGYIIYLYFTDGVKTYSPPCSTIGFYMVYTELLNRKNIAHSGII